jgi:aminoglycoside phosphotransferase (APT) family kinase protein
MPEPRAHALARALVVHLRGALESPELDLAESPARISGGFDTEIYALRLRRAPRAFARPLVLRVLRPHHEPARVLREQATQNAVADLGYPAPRVLLAVTDSAVLGAPFLLMERLSGRTLLETRAVGMGAVLADLQLRLHALDSAPLARTLGPAFTLDGYLDALGARIDRGALDGLAPLLAWLRAHRPADGALAICHGDFHPQNVIVDRGGLTGVLDWPNALVADPAFDVASTLNILRFVPAGLTSMPPALRGLARLFQPLLAHRYLGRYRRRRSIDDARLAYYQPAAALRALVRAGESRRGVGGAPSGLDASPYAARLLEHARRVTGVIVSLPSQ